MEIILGLVCFFTFFRLLASLVRLPVGWSLVGAVILALIAAPAATYLVRASTAAFVGTEVCMPLLYPLLVVAAAVAGFLFGTRFFGSSRQPLDPF